MRRRTYRTLALLAATFAAALQMYADPRSIGGVFSLNGSGISYQHGLNAGRFYEVRLNIDYGHSVFGERCAPGMSASYSYNIVFARKEYASGTLTGYGGPGVVIGYGKDSFSSVSGLMGGLTGTVAMEYRFKVPVTISLGISPCLGFMFSRQGDKNMLDYYIGGVTYGFLPQVGIRYNF